MAKFNLAAIESRTTELRNGRPISKSGFCEVRHPLLHYGLVSEGAKALSDFEKWKEMEVLGPNACAYCNGRKKVIGRNFKDPIKGTNAFYALHTIRHIDCCYSIEEPLALLYPTDGTALLVTEHVPGKNLFRAKEEGGLKGKALAICCSISEKIADLHKANALHMHPHALNCFVKSDGGTLLVDPKHLRFLEFTRKNLEEFIREISFFILTSMGRWDPRYCANVLYDNTDAQECMRAYLAMSGISEDYDYAMNMFSNVKCELEFNMRR